MTTPSTVGYMFIEQFYSKMNQQPQKLYQFYTKQSTVSHAFENEEAQLARGQAEVQKLIQREKFLHNCQVLVSNLDCVESLDGGVVLQVTGEMSNGELAHDFSQTFFLAKGGNGYFVLNDLLRVHGEGLEDDEEVEEAQAQVAPQVAPVPQVPTTPAQVPTPAQPREPREPRAPSQPKNSAQGAPGASQKVFYSAYLKVSPQVDRDELRKALAQIGEVTHLQLEPDKSRAFVDFVDQKTLDKALSQKTVQAGQQKVVIEPRKRRTKPKST